MLSQPSPAIKTRPNRIVLLGVGNDLHADDAAGLLVIRALEARLGSSPNVLLIEGGITPENFTGSIRRFGADWVIFIDAANLEVEPGTIEVLPIEQVDGFSASSHMQPLSVLAKFITRDVGCQVGVIAIQAQSLEMEQAVSGAVMVGVNELVEEFCQLLI